MATGSTVVLPSSTHSHRGDRHVILVVEDDPVFAATLVKLLGRLGYDAILAASFEEAKPHILAGDFCLMLTDLEIPGGPGEFPDRQEGLNVIESGRATFPGETKGRRKSLVQILAMSGRYKSVHDGERALQEGADAFVSKPLNENVPPLMDKLRNSLRLSGRANSHARCKEITEAARSATPQPAAESALTAPVSLFVTGRENKKQTEVRIGESAVLLTGASFVILLKLVAARCRGANEWVHKSDLGATGDHGWKAVSRLKSELRGFVPTGIEVIGNDKSGGYQLATSVAVAVVDWRTLGSHTDGRVQAIASRAVAAP
jgi:DNA-binding response OmpR family regulator